LTPKIALHARAGGRACMRIMHLQVDTPDTYSV